MTEDPVVIRRAVAEDIPAMASLLEELFTIETDFQVKRENQETGLALLLDRNDVLVLVAEVTGQVAGMCTVQQVVSTSEGTYSGLLEDMIVTESYRGKGIGARLLVAAERWAAEQNLTRIQLLADVRNVHALAFYSRQGWERTDMICLRKSPLSDFA